MPKSLLSWLNKSFKCGQLPDQQQGQLHPDRYASTALLVDAGFGVKDTFERLEKVGYVPEQLSGILITHEHGDHAQGANRLARPGRCLCTSQGTSLGAKLESPHVIKDMQRFQIDDIEVLLSWSRTMHASRPSLYLSPMIFVWVSAPI